MSFWAGNRQPDLATLADPLSRSQRSLIRADTGRGVTQDLELVKSSHLYLYSAFNNTNCNKALHNIKIFNIQIVNNVK